MITTRLIGSSGSLLALTLLVGTALTPVAAMAQPTLTSLGQAYSIGMNADGNAVSGINAGTAFRWTRSGGFENLGGIPGSSQSWGAGISGDGTTVVGYGFTPSSYAFRWTSAGGMTDIGRLPGASSASAFGTNGDGSVVVGGSYAAGVGTAFRWTTSAGMQSLGTLPGDNASEARGTSGDGNTVVGSSNNDTGYHVFRWTAGAGMVSLPALPGDLYGAFPANNSPVSADGRFVAGGGDTSAIRWDAVGTPQALGVPTGFDFSFSDAISGDGSTVVGFAGTLDGNSQCAYYWSAATGPVNLNTYLASLGLDLAGWNFTEAQNVSFDGRTIIAFGTFNGQPGSAVISNVPTPGAAGVLALGGLLAAARRRR